MLLALYPGPPVSTIVMDKSSVSIPHTNDGWVLDIKQHEVHLQFTLAAQNIEPLCICVIVS